MVVKKCYKCGAAVLTKRNYCDRCASRCAICGDYSIYQGEVRCKSHIGMGFCSKCGELYKGTSKGICISCFPKCEVCGKKAYASSASRCIDHKITPKCKICNKYFKGTQYETICNNCFSKCEICGERSKYNGGGRCEKHISIFVCHGCGKLFKNKFNGYYCKDCHPKCIVCGENSYKSDMSKCKKHIGYNKCEKCNKIFKYNTKKTLCDSCMPNCKTCGKKLNDIADKYCSLICAGSGVESIEKRKKTCLDRYGVEYYCMSKDMRDKSGNIISNINKERAEKLQTDLFEFPLGNFVYDLKLGNRVIEINPSITHNTYFSPFGNCITQNYHKLKTSVAEENGYKCFHIFDWDDPYKVIEFLTRKIEKKYYARNLIIKEVPYEEGKELINKYHFQGDYRIRNGRIGLGLYDGDELIMITTRGKPRMNKGGEGVYELWRLCTKGGAIVVGGFERLFKHFIKIYNPIKIISYCDRAKFSGEAYRKVGMIEIANKPSIHYYHPRLNKHITGFGLRTLGFDNVYGGMPAPQKCIFTKDIFRKGFAPENREDIVINKGDPIPFFNKIVGDKTTNNIKLLLAIGFLPVPDCGQSTFVRENTKKV